MNREWTCSICGRIFLISDKEDKPQKEIKIKEMDRTLKQCEFRKDNAYYLEYSKNPFIGMEKSDGFKAVRIY